MALKRRVAATEAESLQQAAVEQAYATATQTPVKQQQALTEQVPAVAPKSSAPLAFKPPAADSIFLVWEYMKDEFIAEFDGLPRLKAGSGNITDSDDKDLGRWVEIQIRSFNEIYVVGPCDKKGPANLIRYSYDNITFNDGTEDMVAPYLADLKANWPEAASERYYEVLGALRAAEKPSDHIGGMVQIQLSPTSVTAFEEYRKQLSHKIAMGQADPLMADECRIEAVLESAKGNSRTKLVPKQSVI